MIITQEPTEALTALHGLCPADIRVPREQQDIVLPLMIPLSMEMLDIFVQGSPQRALTEEDHLGQALLFH
jgi:hypothetical protein